MDRLLWPAPKLLSDARFNRDSAQDSDDLLQGSLRAYCLGLIKCCDFTHGLISSHHSYEVRCRGNPLS
jgi:hypothetical protein